MFYFNTILLCNPKTSTQNLKNLSEVMYDRSQFNQIIRFLTNPFLRLKIHVWISRKCCLLLPMSGVQTSCPLHPGHTCVLAPSRE